MNVDAGPQEAAADHGDERGLDEIEAVTHQTAQLQRLQCRMLGYTRIERKEPQRDEREESGDEKRLASILVGVEQMRSEGQRPRNYGNKHGAADQLRGC